MRILISAYTGLGNFVLKTPVIKKLKELYPEAEIEIIAGNSYGAEFVLQGSDLISCTHVLKVEESFLKKAQFFWEMRKKEYDAILLPFDAMPTFLIMGVLFQKGIKFAHINYSLNKTIKQKIRNIVSVIGLPGFRFIPLLQGRHEVDLNYDLLERFLDHPFKRDYQTMISVADDFSVLTQFKLQKKEYVVIQPAAANGSLTSKVWAPDNFRKLIGEIYNSYPDMNIVLVGDDGDLRSIESTSLSSASDVINLMGKTTINELAIILSKALVVIAHDSGIMHMANALDVNLVALYGPTDNTRTRPLGAKSRVIFSHNDCFSRMYNFKSSENELSKLYPNYKCMDGISIENVMTTISDILEEK